ncbi:MAG: PD-(D/E)XK nuclease family protein [candidate division WOR-3 bacterium]
MQGKIFVTPLGQSKITLSLFQDICDLTQEKDFSSILYIAATPRKVKETRMQFSQWVKAQAFIPPQFFTIKDFAIQLYSTYGDKFILPDFLKPVLIQTLNPKITIGYAQRIANFIKEIKLYLYHEKTESIKKAIEDRLAGYEPTLKRIDEAFKIFKDYNQTLNKNGWLDSEDVLLNVPNLVKNLNEFNLILEGFIDLTPVEVEILKSLVMKAKKTVAVVYWWEEKEILAEGKNQSLLDEVSQATPNRFWQFFQGLNDFTIKKLPKEFEFRGSVRYYGFGSLEEEVEGIARQIKKRYIENNLNLDKTVVTFPQLATYAPIVDRIFPKYGIPYTLIPKKNLKTSALAIAVIELLKTIAEDCPSLSTTITLTNPFFQNLSQVVKKYTILFAKQAKITKGKENWFYLQKRFETYFEDELSANEKNLLTATEKGIRQFLEEIKDFDKGQANIVDWVTALKDLLASLGLSERVVRADPTLRYEYDLIQTTFNQLQTLGKTFGSKSYTLPEFIKLLDFLFDRKEYELERKEQGVRVIDIKDTIGLDFEELYFGGLIEGSFPNRPAKDPLLSEVVRKYLGFPDIDYHFRLQELDYLRLINSTKNEPFLTHAQEEGDRLLLPSPFLEGPPSLVEPDNYLLSEEEVGCFQGQKENISFPRLLSEVDFSQDKLAGSVLNQKYGGKNYFSVTELEKYRQCPFIFYIENVLELAPETMPLYEIDALFWGKITHRVFELLYQDGAVPITEIPAKIEMALARVLNEEKISHFWQEVAKKIFARITPEFIQIETALRNDGFTPYQLETHLRYEIIPDLRIKGRFDRIDRSGKRLRILDYKTGRSYVNIKDIKESGTHLQLPLYAKLVQLTKPNFVIDDIGIYSLRDMKIYWLVKGKNDLDELIRSAVNFASAAVKGILQGKFSALPSEKQDCRDCEYNALCAKPTNVTVYGNNQE